jgi:SAM-dependent methyltransferase
LTRRYTTKVLLDAMKRAAAANNGPLSIVEIGGANSCFLDAILAALAPRSYDVVDTNQHGLSLLAGRLKAGAPVRLHQQSVFEMNLGASADLVFSVGLVEHFDQPGTRAAVAAHFDVLRPGGTAIITFPTPTLLYRATRKAIASVGMWKFHDERPLHPAEVRPVVEERGTIVVETILWPLMLTQCLIVATKR